MAIIKEARQVADFSKVALWAVGDIQLVQAPHYALEIAAEESLLADLITEVQDDTLIIRFPDKVTRRFNNTKSIQYTLHMPEISAVSISGAGNLSAASIQTRSLALHVSGSGNISLQALDAQSLSIDITGHSQLELGSVQVQALDVRVSGNAQLTMPHLTSEVLTSRITGQAQWQVEGQARVQTLTVPGVLNYKAAHLKSEVCTVQATGMSNLKLWVEAQLTLDLQGVGQVEYYGNPRISKKARGLVKIKPLNATPA